MSETYAAFCHVVLRLLVVVLPSAYRMVVGSSLIDFAYLIIAQMPDAYRAFSKCICRQPSLYLIGDDRSSSQMDVSPLCEELCANNHL